MCRRRCRDLGIRLRMGTPLEGSLIWATVSPGLHPHFTTDNPSPSIFTSSRFRLPLPAQSWATTGKFSFLDFALWGLSRFTVQKLSPGRVD